MIVWQINTPEATPIDSGQVRLRRSSLLADAVVARGHELHWWSANFFHASKKHRFRSTTSVSVRDRYRVTFIHGPGYRKNISLARLVDHHIVASRFLRLARREPKPDVILCSCPTLDLSRAAVVYGRGLGVPVVLDIRDLWPDTLIDPFPALLRPLAAALLSPYRKMAAEACHGASSIIGSTAEFVRWGLAKAGRVQGPFDREFPFGYEAPELKSEERLEALSFWHGKGVRPTDGHFNLCFFGTVGHQFDFDTVIRAAQRLPQSLNARFILCGDGDRRAHYARECARDSSILFPGWVDASRIWELMAMSHAALAPYISTDNFRDNLTNKPIEYMAGGLPILASLRDGVLAQLITTHGCGLTYGNDPDLLAAHIVTLARSPEVRLRMAQSARQLYETRYRASEVYGALAEHLETVASSPQR